MRKILNFTAAYPEIEEQVKLLGMNKYPYFRVEEFDNIVADIKSMTLDILETDNSKYVVSLLSSSGTGAMDAVLSNFSSNKDKVLVIKGGRFGELWCQLCKFYGLDYYEYRQQPGRDIDLEDFEKAINKFQPSIVLMQHNETSLMQLNDIDSVGLICKRIGIKLFVDACSSFAIDKISLKDSHIDALIFSSQKGLLVQAGLAMIVYKKELSINPKSFYFDLSKYEKMTGKFIMPFTPLVVVIHQLHYRLKQIVTIGIDEWIAKPASISAYFRNSIKDLPLKIASSNLTNCGTALITNNLNNKFICEELLKLDIFITNSVGFWGDFISIGHIGDVNFFDVDILVEELKKCLK